MATSRARNNVVLFGLWLALAGVTAFAWLNPPKADTVAATAAADDEVAGEFAGDKLAPFVLPPLADYQEVVERPIFYQARRPPPPEAEPKPEAEPVAVEEEVGMTLIGVMLVGDTKTALIQNETTRKVVSLKLGDKFENWELDRIDTDRVALRRGSETKELALERNKRKPSRQITQKVERLKQQQRLARLRQRQQQDAADGEQTGEGAQGEQGETLEGETPEEGEETDDEDADTEQENPAQASAEAGNAQSEQENTDKQLNQQQRDRQKPAE